LQRHKIAGTPSDFSHRQEADRAQRHEKQFDEQAASNLVRIGAGMRPTYRASAPFPRIAALMASLIAQRRAITS
jgi:hypothetical protein